jgi:hypothetical protein
VTDGQGCAIVEWFPPASGQGLTKKQVAVTLSAFLLSVLSGNAPHARAAVRGWDGVHDHRSRPLSQELEDLRRYETYRKFFPMTEIALAATALRNRAIAKWVRDHVWRLTCVMATSSRPRSRRVCT